jgi:N-acyl-D-amino-acid deacylase
VPQTSPLALTRDVNMRNPFSFGAFPCWSRVFADKSKAAQRAVYADPAFRNACRTEIKGNIDWRRLTVHEMHKPELKRYEGRTVADVATERGVDPSDAFLDLTIEDDLDIEFVLAQFNVNVDLVKDNLVDPNVLIALGDGGAHVDMLCDAGYPTYLLGTWVRERQIMSLEQAVARLTAQPADLFGIKGRGRLAFAMPPISRSSIRSASARRAGASAASICRGAPSAWSCRPAASNTRSSTDRSFMPTAAPPA